MERGENPWAFRTVGHYGRRRRAALARLDIHPPQWYAARIDKRARDVSITYGPSKIKGTFVSFVPRPKPASPVPWPEKENHKPGPKDELKEGVSSRLS